MRPIAGATTETATSHLVIATQTTGATKVLLAPGDQPTGTTTGAAAWPLPNN